MSYNKSLQFLDKCLDNLKTATPEEVKRMQEAYKENTDSEKYYDHPEWDLVLVDDVDEQVK